MFFKKLWRSFIISFINSLLSGTHFFALKRFLLNSCYNIKIGRKTKIVGKIFLGNISKVLIADDCWIGSNFKVLGNGFISIGSNCDIAPNCTFILGTHEVGEKTRRAGNGIDLSIKIGTGNWICSNNVFLGNIEIGDSNIIGACSFVNKNFESNYKIFGNPAKIISKLND